MALALSAASSRAQTIKKNETGLPVYPNIKTGIQYKINGGYGPALPPINGMRYDTYVASSCTSMFRVPESFTPPSRRQPSRTYAFITLQRQLIVKVTHHSIGTPDGPATCGGDRNRVCSVRFRSGCLRRARSVGFVRVDVQ